MRHRTSAKTAPRRPDALDTPELVTPRFFGAGVVADILGIDQWRLQKFLNSPRFGLSSSESSVTVQGARRVFTELDVYRIGIAAHLTNDGFTPKLVSEVNDAIEPEHLLGFERGEETDFGLGLTRSKKGPVARVFVWSDRQEFTKTYQPYYTMNLTGFCRTVKELMKAAAEGQVRQK